MTRTRSGSDRIARCLRFAAPPLSFEPVICLLDRFRREMAETRFTCNNESFAVTLSIGVARFLDGDTQETWIERTDKALYRAKEAGRNRVIIA